MSTEMSSPVQPSANRPAAKTSSANGKAVPPNQATEGNRTPPTTPNGGGEKSEAAKKAQEVREAVRDIEEYVQNTKRELSFSVDEELNRTVIKVFDQANDQLIRQIPREEILDIARTLHDLTENQATGLQIREKV